MIWLRAILCLLLLTSLAEAGSVTLCWDPSPGTITGYRLYYKTTGPGGVYTTYVDPGVGGCTDCNTCRVTIPNLAENARWYFVATAYLVGQTTIESGYSNEVNVLLDVTNPDVFIGIPTSDPSYSSTSPIVTVEGTASDNAGVASVAYRVTPSNATGNCTGTASWLCDSVPFLLGSNLLTITATDIFGLTGTDTLAVTYSQDTTPPAVTITGPTSEITWQTDSASLTLSGTSSDAVGVTSVAWSSDRNQSGSCTGTGEWSCAAGPLLVGLNTLTVTSSDAAGNTGTDTLAVTYLPAFDPVLSAPTNLTATQLPSGTMFSWSAPTLGVTGYVLTEKCYGSNYRTARWTKNLFATIHIPSGSINCRTYVRGYLRTGANIQYSNRSNTCIFATASDTAYAPNNGTECLN